MSIWHQTEYISKKSPRRAAIGNVSGETVSFTSYEKLMRDALAAAALIAESGEEHPLAVGLGAYYTAVFVLAASRLGISLTLSASGEKGVMLCGSLVSPSELPSRLAGILSASDEPSLPPKFRPAFFTLSDGTSYSEEAVIFSARAFSDALPLLRPDRLLYLFPEHSAEGLFCGIIAPLLKGAASMYCPERRSLLKFMKLTSPTRLFSGELEARALLLKLLRIKKLHLDQSKNAESERSLRLMTDPTLIAVKRLIRPKILYSLGGRLKTVAVRGELSQKRMRCFFSFGIYALAVGSERGLCPSLFHFGGDGRGVWRLPAFCRADICRAEKGGIGRIIIFSPAIREGESIDGTYVPLEKHSDGAEDALVTTVSGYILKDGSVFKVDR